MFIAKYKLEGKEYSYIYYDREEFIKDTFSPMCEIIGELDFKLSGKTYQEKKNSLEELAKDWQLHFADGNWSYGELAEIQGYLYDNAKRYGLLKEFRENCIC